MATALWEEALPIVGGYTKPDVWECQIFSYFPELRLSSLLGTVFVDRDQPVSTLPYGPSLLLLEEDLPPEKEMYVYVVSRRAAKTGVMLEYLLPFIDDVGDARVEVEAVVVDDDEQRERLIEIEALVPVYARNFMEGL